VWGRRFRLPFVQPMAIATPPTSKANSPASPSPPPAKNSDPNREDDPGYIVRLIVQAVPVSIETRSNYEIHPG